ncbi:hypothetical protein [Hymenobacter rubripertinctus]|uniref:Uncharacterized protein n=1 Tax=Hymenobacter rubripertinctus TaxID=2029981 RepID=A0A418R8L8_9BACT|nr:hypothetical protein [Hymenobacter rubripertinctus]RIY13719.1 hypothetical protein D0T11_01160 [Hymenobacter rubripertinctus]
MAPDQYYPSDMNTRLEESFRAADEAREDLSDSVTNSVAANCDLLHHGLISSQGFEVTTEMYRHLLSRLLRHPSGEVRAQALALFNESMEQFWPKRRPDAPSANG